MTCGRSALMLAAAALLITGCGPDLDGDTGSDAGAPQPRSFNAAGTLLADNGDGTPGDSCQGIQSLGLGDLSAGTSVSVSDGRGAELAIGVLGPGTFVDVMTRTAAPDGAILCAFPFEVQDIPRGSAEYAIGVGSRSGPRFSKDQADSLKLFVSGPGRVKMAPSRYRLGPDS